MLDSVGFAAPIKRDTPIPFRSFSYGKLNAVVREDSVNCLGHHFNQAGQEITGNQSRCPWMQSGIGKL